MHAAIARAHRRAFEHAVLRQVRVRPNPAGGTHTGNQKPSGIALIEVARAVRPQARQHPGEFRLTNYMTEGGQLLTVQEHARSRR